jgi:nucleoside-diphosphate-sugar epimerase
VGVETVACDLLDREEICRLPDCPNVVFMAGMKFGTTGAQAMTWAMNALVPSYVAERFSQSRIVAFSSGNVYRFTEVDSGGPTEDCPPDPVGEYAQSVLARERVFEYFSQTAGTPVSIIRLNYAIDLRYGVLFDIANKVWAGDAVDVSTGYVNVIWQGDANRQALLSLRHCSSPPAIFNVAGPEILSVRKLAEEFGVHLEKPVVLQGTEAPTALLSNASKANRLFGSPRVSVENLVRWIAEWVRMGGPVLGKPTHFEVRDGKF